MSRTLKIYLTIYSSEAPRVTAELLTRFFQDVMDKVKASFEAGLNFFWAAALKAPAQADGSRWPPVLFPYGSPPSCNFFLQVISKAGTGLPSRHTAKGLLAANGFNRRGDRNM